MGRTKMTMVIFWYNFGCTETLKLTVLSQTVVKQFRREVLNFANSVWWLIIAKSVPAFQWKEEIFCCYFAFSSFLTRQRPVVVDAGEAVEEEAEEEEEVEEAEDTFLEEAVVMETISGSL